MSFEIISPTIVLNYEEKEILKSLFSEHRKIYINREFGGGMGGCKVLQVTPEKCASFIVKIGFKNEIKKEQEAWENHFAMKSPAMAVNIKKAEYTKLTGGILYVDANSAGFGNICTLSDIFLEKSRAKEILPILRAFIQHGMKNIYEQYKIEKLNFSELYSTLLPENIICKIEKKAGHFVVNSDDFKKESIPEGTVIFTPETIDTGEAGLKESQSIFLQNFIVSKIKSRHLHLEDENKTKYKLKVQYETYDQLPDNLIEGSGICVLGKLITTRYLKLNSALIDSLKKLKAKQKDNYIIYNNKNYFYPLNLYKNILNRICLVKVGSIHGDLHWSNILVDSFNTPWLIDFGCSKEGPILFDFIKLELYLRLWVLSTIEKINFSDLFDFEKNLAEDPLGKLGNDISKNPELQNAAKIIQCIRNLCLPYLYSDLSEYWQHLFIYSVSMLKYYPHKTSNSYSTNEIRKFLFLIPIILNMGNVLNQLEQLKPGTKPLFKSKFVDFGTTLSPQRGQIALDVGSQLDKGVIDHHQFSENIIGECAATLLVKNPDLITRHKGIKNIQNTTFVMHRSPDFDCVTSSYLTQELIQNNEFPYGTSELANYAKMIDSGDIPLHADFKDTPYAYFSALTALESERTEKTDHKNQTDERDNNIIKDGFKLVDFLLENELLGNHHLSTNKMPSSHPFMELKEYLENDETKYQLDISTGEKLSIKLWRETGVSENIEALYLNHPRSLLYKMWARSDRINSGSENGFELLVVRWIYPDKENHRIVISVKPNSKFNLQGLAAALERREKEKRKLENKTIKGKPRKGFEDFSLSHDPWYDGRSSIHNYTIIDSPGVGTILTVKEIIDIIKDGPYPPGSAL